MTIEATNFRWELKWWYNFWERKLKNESKEEQGASKTKKRVDDNPGFTLEDPPDGIVETLLLGLCWHCCSFQLYAICPPIGSTEAERAASRTRPLKAPYQSTMGKKTLVKRESDLSLFHLGRIYKLSLRCISKSNPKKCLRNLHYLKINCCWKQKNKIL